MSRILAAVLCPVLVAAVVADSPPGPPKGMKVVPFRVTVDLLARAEYREIPLTILPHATAIPLGVMVQGAMEWMLDQPARNDFEMPDSPQ